MTKPVIITRAGKGSALTWTEGDTNLTNLRDATISVAGDSGTINGGLNDTFHINGGNGIGTAVVNGDLVVNLNGVYGGDSTSSTTVGNNTAVLLSTVATSGSYTDLTNKPSLATVATSGSYTDLTNTPSSSGTNQIILYLSGTNQISIPYNNSATTVSTSKWTIATNGGISGMSVSGTDGTITLPAGTYWIEMPPIITQPQSANVGDPSLWNFTNNRAIATLNNGGTISMAGQTMYFWMGGYHVSVVLSGTTNIGFVLQGSGTGTASFRAAGYGQLVGTSTGSTQAGFPLKILKTA